MIKKYILYLLYILCYGCFSIDLEISKESNTGASNVLKETKQTTKLPNDIRWVTNSSEYKILCEQIYQNAWTNLSSVLNKTTNETAIIMDLDETVLDNSKYQIGLAEKNETYNPESWSAWVNLKEAELIPGVKEFIDSVHSLVFILTCLLSFEDLFALITTFSV